MSKIEMKFEKTINSTKIVDIIFKEDLIPVIKD
jgi:hypothetical protein